MPVDQERARKLLDAVTREAQRYSFEEAMHAFAAATASAITAGPVPKEHRTKVLQTFVGNVILGMQKLDRRDDPLGAVTPN
jgi:hypothetical protein